MDRPEKAKPKKPSLEQIRKQMLELAKDKNDAKKAFLEFAKAARNATGEWYHIQKERKDD